MRILVYEDNLLWASRIVRSLTAFGHEPIALKKPEVQGAPVAIVNLGSSALEPLDLVPKLRALGVRVIGHAGHKERELLALGAQAGCDIVATNSEITYKIEALIGRAISVA